MVWKVELAKSAEAELGKFDPQVAWRVSAGNFGDCKLVGDGSFRTAGGYWSRLSRVLRKIRAGADNFIVWGRQRITTGRHHTCQGLLGELETEQFVKNVLNGTVFHTEETIKELRADRQFAVEYLKAALEELDDPNNRAAGLLALRDVAEVYGGLGVVAAQAGISREALYRSLSPKGIRP